MKVHSKHSDIYTFVGADVLIVSSNIGEGGILQVVIIFIQIPMNQSLLLLLS
jgi:hypothetical protein